jgi:glycosyltransferase involved in cell wall biosynthesis
MNILLLSHTYPDKNNSWRGSFVRDQASVLSKNNTVKVVYFKIDYEHFDPFAHPEVSESTNGNLTEYTLTIKRSFPVFNQINYLFRTYRFIRKSILSYFLPDIIHSHLTYPAGLLGTLLQKRKKIPGVITEHSKITNYYRSWFHRKCVTYSLRNASGIIAVSESLKSEIVMISQKPCSVIYNIVDVEKFDIMPKPQSLINIGFLGGLGNNNKGLDLLIRALSLLDKSSFRLHVGGKGILLETYVQMAKESGIDSNCIFYGEILRDKISEFYSKLDLFVLPSRYETFGIVLIEAMSCGLPVIATKCGGPEEIVTPVTGLLIEKENIPELTLALKNMVENLGSYDKAAIRNYAEKKFGKKIFIERIIRFYSEIITNTRND